MHPYLTRLGVPENVQLFFEPHYTSDHIGNLLFPYGDQFEAFGFAYHRVPQAIHPWTAGDILTARQVLICGSALEAIAFLSLNSYRFTELDQLLFISVGNCPTFEQLNLMQPNCQFGLIFGKDILGRLADVRIAAMLRNYPVSLHYNSGFIMALSRGVKNAFSEPKLTLNAFEKVSGFRAGIRTYKSKYFDSFLEQLKHQSNYGKYNY